MCWGNGIGYCKVKKYVKKISHNSIIRFNFHTLNDINDDSLEPRRDHHQYHTQWSVAFHLKSGHSKGWLMYSDSRFPAYNLLSSSPTSLLRISMIAFLQRLSIGNRLVVMFLYRSRVYVAENVKSIITFSPHFDCSSICSHYGGEEERAEWARTNDEKTLNNKFLQLLHIVIVTDPRGRYVTSCNNILCLVNDVENIPHHNHRPFSQFNLALALFSARVGCFLNAIRASWTFFSFDLKK